MRILYIVCGRYVRILYNKIICYAKYAYRFAVVISESIERNFDSGLYVVVFHK